MALLPCCLRLSLFCPRELRGTETARILPGRLEDEGPDTHVQVMIQQL